MKLSDAISNLIVAPIEVISYCCENSNKFSSGSHSEKILLSEVADVKLVEGVSGIRRENGRRTINVWASIDAEQVEPFKVAKDIRESYIPKLLEQYPGISTNLTGRVQEERL